MFVLSTRAISGSWGKYFLLSDLHVATLGFILDSQLSWESGKLQLARWSHRVVIFLVRTDPTQPDPADPTRPPDGLVWKVLYLSWYLSDVHQISTEEFPIMSVPLLCLSPPIMSVPTVYVCPHLLCLSPPIMSVPTYYVCPHLFCLSPPIILC